MWLSALTVMLSGNHGLDMRQVANHIETYVCKYSTHCTAHSRTLKNGLSPVFLNKNQYVAYRTNNMKTGLASSTFFKTQVNYFTLK